MSAKSTEEKNLKITLVRSAYADTQKQRDTLLALGLRRPRQSVLKTDNPMIRGMVNVVSHLVETEEVGKG